MNSSTRRLLPVILIAVLGCSQSATRQDARKAKRNTFGVNITKTTDAETWFIPSLDSKSLKQVAKRAIAEAPSATWSLTVGGKHSVGNQLTALRESSAKDIAISHLRWTDEQPGTALLHQIQTRRVTFVNVTWTDVAWNALAALEIESLALVNCRFGDTDFDFSNGFANLQRLTLDRTNCPDSTLESLADRTALTTLTLSETDSNEIAVLQLLGKNANITTAHFDASRWHNGRLNLVVEPELFTGLDETMELDDSNSGTRLLNKLGNQILAATLAANELAPVLAEIKKLEAVTIQVVVTDPSDDEQLAAFEVIRPAIPTCEFECVAAPAPSADPNIDYYRSGLDHTGYRPDLKFSPTPKLRHRYGLINVGIHTASKSSPVINGDQVFVGADSGFFYAFDRATLQLQWRFRVRATAKHGIHGTAAVDSDTVYIGAYDGWIYALDRLDGQLKWQTRVGDYIGASLVIWKDRLYAGVEIDEPNGYVSCVNKSTGEIIFQSDKVGGHTHCTPTINTETRTIFIGGNQGNFLALDADTGKTRWSFRSQGDIKSTAALFDGSALFSSWDKQIYKLDQKTGKQQWSFATRSLSMSSPTIDSDERRVYVGGHDGQLYALDFDTGKLLWSFQTGQKIMSSAIVVRNASNDEKLVVFGSHDFNVYGLNASNGELRFKIATQGNVSGVPVIHEDALYISGDDGYLYVWE